MDPAVPPDLIARAELFERLSRWERSDLGVSLRRLGLTYREIMTLILVPKSTLSYWCRDVELTRGQKEAIRARTGSVAGVPRDTQRRRREEVEELRLEAAAQAKDLLDDPLWVAGLVLYWAEGSKSKRSLEMVNSDPELLRMFIGWVIRYLEPEPTFTLMLHLHEGNDEGAAKRYWARQLGFAEPEWHKTYIKPAGTGHRNNRLLHGVCRVRMRRSANAFVRVEGWIAGTRGRLAEGRTWPSC